MILRCYCFQKATIMKFSRLLAYGAAGIIVGLLIENKALILKQAAAGKARLLKKKAGDLLPKG